MRGWLTSLWTSLWTSFCVVVVVVSGFGCSPGLAHLTEGAKLDLERSASATLSDFQADSRCTALFQSSHAWAVFPKITKGAFGLGISDGTGQVYVGPDMVGYAKVSSVTIGPQIGGQSFSEIIFFKTRHALDLFKVGGLTGQAGAGVAFGSAGEQKLSQLGDHVVIYTANHDGLILAADVGGQSFDFAYRH